MTKAYLINSSMAALATAFILTASLSSANAGWGENGQYGNTPTPGQTQSAPAHETGGYGGGQSRPTDNWGGGRPSRPTGPFGSGSYQTNSYPDRERPCRRCTRPYVPAQTYNERPDHGTVYLPPNRGTVYVPPSRDTYNNGGGYNPGRGTVYVPPRRDTWSSGGGYGGSQPASSSWNASGGYGGRR